MIKLINVWKITLTYTLTLLQANDFWMDDMYMKVKLPLPVNSNPGMAFPRQHFEDDSARLRFTARLISGIMDYKTILDV